MHLLWRDKKLIDMTWEDDFLKAMDREVWKNWIA